MDAKAAASGRSPVILVLASPAVQYRRKGGRQRQRTKTSRRGAAASILLVDVRSEGAVDRAARLVLVIYVSVSHGGVRGRRG